MNEELDLLLEKLSNACGLGYSTEATRLVEREARKYTKEVTIDKSASVVATSRGRGKKRVMLAAHVDEVGFVVSGIEDGYLRIAPIGGIDPRVLPGQEVTVYGRRRLRGYIGITAPHYTTPQDRERVLAIKDLYVDTGLPNARIKRLVQIGDGIVYAGRYAKLAGHLRRGKALDNRAGVACGLAVLKMLSRVKHDCDLHFVATAQEEELGLGARINAYRLDLDLGLAVDVTYGDHPESKEHEIFPLGRGPVLGKGPVLSARVFDGLAAAANRLEIPFQVECLPRATRTDADYIALAKEGVPTGLVSIPVRYMHTPVEVVSLSDIERAARVIADFLVHL